MKEENNYLRIDPISAVVRFYRNTIDEKKPLHEMVEAYYKTLTLTFLDDGCVRISACLDSPTLRETRDLFKELSARGFKKVFWKHHKKEICLNL